ncbi:hypothetical protein BaRGS_00022999, partial [Batillaria attramentaria]
MARLLLCALLVLQLCVTGTLATIGAACPCAATEICENAVCKAQVGETCTSGGTDCGANAVCGDTATSGTFVCECNPPNLADANTGACCDVCDDTGSKCDTTATPKICVCDSATHKINDDGTACESESG